jgi:iron complex outermembrane receptor protein
MKQNLLLLNFFWPAFSFAQLSGRVTNENNEGISYATVAIKNTGNAIATDSAGYFVLTGIPKFPFTIIVSHTGYKSLERTIRNNQAGNIVLQLQLLYRTDTIVVTSRRRSERLQDVPIPVSVIGGPRLDNAGAYNVNLVKNYIPSMQLYSSNPRNTGVNIRGIGSPFGLTNDGLDPGVGFYVDGIYYARPAAATLDFIDIERIEVLRGPQGTLFGKNTTAGAINIITNKPDFKPGRGFEVSYGNYGFVQAKSSLTGPLSKKLAARISFSGTQRDGVLKNIITDQHTNDINNIAFHAQLLYKLATYTSITVSGDAARQRPNGYAQVIAGVVHTQRPAYRQFDAIISDLNYQLPTLDPFARIIDHDTPWQSDNDLGGTSLTVETKIGPGTLTSATAWRYWNWNPSNDRDFTALQALAKSQNPSKHRNWSQEVRYAGSVSNRVSGVAGLFFIDQQLKTTGTEESGKDQWRFIQNSEDSNWRTPGLLDGYGAHTNSSIKSKSAALFVNIDWEIANGLHIMPGIRYNYDRKDVIYDRETYGGLQTTDPNLIKLQQVAYSNQSFATGADETHFTYQLTLSYRPNKKINSFITYSTNFKPVGVNVGGLPVINGQTALDLAVIKPEYIKDIEIGIKTNPIASLSVNLTFFNSDIKDYQTNVQSPEIGVNRGYLANAEKVNVKGFELDAYLKSGKHFSFSSALAYTDGKYVKFTNAPLPLEETGLIKDGKQVAFKDISGGVLSGISKWAASFSGEFFTPAAFLGKPGQFFAGMDGFGRSTFSSSPSPSAYLNIKGYVLFNGRLGFKSNNGFSAFIWGHNLFDKNYFDQLLPAGGNAGQYAAVLGDPLTYGITLKYKL